MSDKISVSIVLFNPDLSLLRDVVEALRHAFYRLSPVGSWCCSLDLVNNNPCESRIAEISKLAYATGSSNFSVSLVESLVNGGYGAGNNISITRHPDSAYHLVLNPDVLVDPDSLEQALSFMSCNLDVGLVTPKVVGFDGEIQYLCKQHPGFLDMLIRCLSFPLLNRIFERRNRWYEMRNHDYDQVICPVPYPSGCFMLFKRALLDQIGGFDEGFFLHYEDADVGRRVSKVSMTAYVPSVAVAHKWTRASHSSWRMRCITIASGLRYIRKWGWRAPAFDF